MDNNIDITSDKEYIKSKRDEIVSSINEVINELNSTNIQPSSSTTKIPNYEISVLEDNINNSIIILEKLIMEFNALVSVGGDIDKIDRFIEKYAQEANLDVNLNLDSDYPHYELETHSKVESAQVISDGTRAINDYELYMSSYDPSIKLPNNKIEGENNE